MCSDGCNVHLHLPSGSSFVAFFLPSGFTPMHDSSVTITTRRSSRSTSTCSNSIHNCSLSHSPHCEHCFKSPQPSALLTVTFFMTYYSIASLLARLASSCMASCSFTQSKFSKTCQQSVCFYMVAITLQSLQGSPRKGAHITFMFCLRLTPTTAMSMHSSSPCLISSNCVMSPLIGYHYIHLTATFNHIVLL